MLRRLRAVELLRFLLVASLACPALILGLTGWFTYQAAFTEAEHELVWTNEVAREHASKVFDSYRLVADRALDLLRGLDDATIRDAEKAFHDTFTGIIRSLPQIESFIVIDRDAHLLLATATFPVSRSSDFSDRDYFNVLKQGPADTYFSRVQTSRVSGKLFFGWGQSRRRADGTFDGVIDIAVSPQFFTQFYKTLIREVGKSPEGRVVTMIRDDGQILVRYPEFAGSPARIGPSNPFFAAVRKNPEGGLYRNRSVIDPGAPERLFSFRKVSGHPIYIVAGRSIEAITGAWARKMLVYVAVGIPAMAVLFLTTLAALAGARRERGALAQARAEMDRRTQVEEQLRQSQKMEAIGQLTGGIAHDFNNMLTIIRSSIDLLRRPDLPDARRRRYLDAIADTTTRAVKLTGQLLAFSRRQALKPERIDVVETVASLVDMVRPLTGPRIAIETAFADGSFHVNADPSQFATSIVNLAVNARDAIAGDGRLTIVVTAAKDIPASPTRPPTAGDYVAIALTDTGTGIPADDLDHIFEPFFTTKEIGQGTGLGLSQVFGFAKQSGGEVTVDSEVGRGTTFTLYLPRVEAAERTTKAPDPPDVVRAGHGIRVLVVEDNKDVGAFVVQTLTDLGYDTVLAAHARAALAELARDARRFDLVFSDVMMPGMTGIELGQEIRRRHADLPVVLTSGYSHALAENGASGFELLQKPYAVEQLSHVLGKAVQRRGDRSAGAASD